MGAMKHLGTIALNTLQWSLFGLWSFFWMSAAILRGTLPPRDPNIPLSWARRFWGPGVIFLTRTNLIRHPGFAAAPWLRRVTCTPLGRDVFIDGDIGPEED